MNTAEPRPAGDRSRVRTPEQVQRDRERSRAWHERQHERLRELAEITSTVNREELVSGRQPDAPAGHLLQRPDAERLAELERRIVELETRDAAREAELIELRAYRQKNRDRSRTNALKRQQLTQTGTPVIETGTTGLRAGLAPAKAARVTHARDTNITKLTNTAAVVVGGAGGLPPAASVVDPDTIWASPEVRTIADHRGLDLLSERVNFEVKRKTKSYTLADVVGWLSHSWPSRPAPRVALKALDRVPRYEPRAAVAMASTAYEHDHWASRGIDPPIDECDRVAGNVL